MKTKDYMSLSDYVLNDGYIKVKNFKAFIEKFKERVDKLKSNCSGDSKLNFAYGRCISIIEQEAGPKLVEVRK